MGGFLRPLWYVSVLVFWVILSLGQVKQSKTTLSMHCVCWPCCLKEVNVLRPLLSRTEKIRKVHMPLKLGSCTLASLFHSVYEIASIILIYLQIKYQSFLRFTSTSQLEWEPAPTLRETKRCWSSSDLWDLTRRLQWGWDPCADASVEHGQTASMRRGARPVMTRSTDQVWHWTASPRAQGQNAVAEERACAANAHVTTAGWGPSMGNTARSMTSPALTSGACPVEVGAQMLPHFMAFCSIVVP